MRERRSSNTEYGSLAVRLHWLSAVAILALIPLGFFMQEAPEGMRLVLYRSHVILGVAILGLTFCRLLWRVQDKKPDPPPGLSGVHLRGMEAIHVLLYISLFALTVSGLVLMAQSGLIAIFRSGAEPSIPSFEEFGARSAHGTIARIYIALLVSHIGGVVIHQIRYGSVFSRIGIGKPGN